MADHDEQHKTIHFTIDGKPFTIRDDDQEAASLLRLAGVDPNAYDLAKVRRDGEPKLFKDQHVVELKEGEEFVTVRQTAPVA